MEAGNLIASQSWPRSTDILGRPRAWRVSHRNLKATRKPHSVSTAVCSEGSSRVCRRKPRSWVCQESLKVSQAQLLPRSRELDLSRIEMSLIGGPHIVAGAADPRMLAVPCGDSTSSPDPAPVLCGSLRWLFHTQQRPEPYVPPTSTTAQTCRASFWVSETQSKEWGLPVGHSFENTFQGLGPMLTNGKRKR